MVYILLLFLLVLGTNESKKNGKIAVVIKMQKYLLEAADVKETDNDLVKSRKVLQHVHIFISCKIINYIS